MTGIVNDESELVAALRDGDEAVFAQLVDRSTPAMLQRARSSGVNPSTAVAPTGGLRRLDERRTCLFLR